VGWVYVVFHETLLILSLLIPSSFSLLVTDEDMIRFQGGYLEQILRQVDYPPLDIEGIILLFLEWEQHKHEDIMGFRDRTYRFV
jgi:hypothetical protein